MSGEQLQKHLHCLFPYPCPPPPKLGNATTPGMLLAWSFQHTISAHTHTLPPTPLSLQPTAPNTDDGDHVM